MDGRFNTGEWLGGAVGPLCEARPFRVRGDRVVVIVAEDTYASFQDRAKEREASASELIREAMSEYAERHFRTGRSVFDHPPTDVGGVIRPLDRDDDLLEEMIG